MINTVFLEQSEEGKGIKWIGEREFPSLNLQWIVTRLTDYFWSWLSSLNRKLVPHMGEYMRSCVVGEMDTEGESKEDVMGQFVKGNRIWEFSLFSLLIKETNPFLKDNV